MKNLSCHYVKKFEINLLFKLKHKFEKTYITLAVYIAHVYFCFPVRFALQIFEARVCIAEFRGVGGFPPSTNLVRRTKNSSTYNIK